MNNNTRVVTIPIDHITSNLSIYINTSRRESCRFRDCPLIDGLSPLQHRINQTLPSFHPAEKWRGWRGRSEWWEDVINKCARWTTDVCVCVCVNVEIKRHENACTRTTEGETARLVVDRTSTTRVHFLKLCHVWFWRQNLQFRET